MRTTEPYRALLLISTMVLLPLVHANSDSISRSNTAYSTLLETQVDEPFAQIAYGADPLQFAELWLPPQSLDATAPTNRSANDAQTKAPLVIFIHGGCWLSAYDIKHSHALSTGLSRSGYAVWSVEYRRTGDPGGGWPGSYNDVVQAINYALVDLKASSTDAQAIDFSKVFLLGHSAGGHLALLASANASIANNIQQTIGLAAITDPALYSQGENSCESATEGFMGGSRLELPQAYEQASVTNKVLPEQTMLLIGSADKIVKPSQAALLTVTTHEIDGAGHFDFIDPYSEAFGKLLSILASTPVQP